jgi:hypothetical protein
MEPVLGVTGFSYGPGVRRRCIGEMTDWAGGLQFPGIHRSSSRGMIVDWRFLVFINFSFFYYFFNSLVIWFRFGGRNPINAFA